MRELNHQRIHIHGPADHGFVLAAQVL
jgi:hypothetical protein